MTENGPELPGRRRSFMSDALLAASGAALALALVAAGWFALGRSNDPASEQLAGSPPAATSVPEPTAPPAVSMPAPEPPPAAAPPPPPPPTPTPTPSDEAPTIRKPVGPVSDATQDTDPWADVPTFTVNGVTVMDVEQVAFGEPADDLIEGFNTYFTRSAQWADDGTFVWWGASPGRAVVTLTIGASGGLEGFDVHLEELGNQDMGLVFVSDGGRWLMPGPFSWDRRDIGDRFIYIEDDDEGLAVRCSFRNFCFHQHSEAGPDGLPTGFGEIVRFRADSRTATDYRITANLTATNGQPTALFAAPQPGAVAAFEVDLTNGVTAAMLGQEVVDAEGISWVHLTLERDALRRAYWARAQDLAPAPAADAQGPLPRLEPAQGPLAGLVGRITTYPFEENDEGRSPIYEFIDEQEYKIAAGGSLLHYGDDAQPNVTATQLSLDGNATVTVIMSQELSEDMWEITAVWNFRLGANQLLSAGSDGDCNFLPDSQNMSMLIVNTDFEPLRGWVPDDNDGFVEVSVADIRCNP